MSINKKMQDDLQAYGVAISNVLTEKDLQAPLAEYGYEIEVVKEGEALHAEAENLMRSQVKEYDEQYIATDEFNAAWKEAKKLYKNDLKFAKLALRKTVGAADKLHFGGKRKVSFTGWYEQALAFYTVLRAESAYLQKLARFKITDEKLAENETEVRNCLLLLKKQDKEQGEAQQATKERDAAFEEISDWYDEFETVAKIAFTETPQLMEKMGIVVPS